jgi:hypothetical protein
VVPVKNPPAPPPPPPPSAQPPPPPPATIKYSTSISNPDINVPELLNVCITYVISVTGSKYIDLTPPNARSSAMPPSPATVAGVLK